MDFMSGCDIRLVFTFPPKDSTLQYKKCVHLWNNFPSISTLINSIKINQIKSNRKTNLISLRQLKSAADYSGARKTVECYD